MCLTLKFINRNLIILIQFINIRSETVNSDKNF